jgi:hypothetical protein
MSSQIVFITPPVTKPSEPNLSGPSAAQVLRSRGVRATWIDASIGWYEHTLRAEVLEPLARARPDSVAHARHLRSVLARPLRRAETYRSRKVYSSAITHLDGALALASTPFPGVRLRIADVSFEGRRAESRAALEELSCVPGPFDDYFTSLLFPNIERTGATRVAISLTFQAQAIGAMRLAHLLRERLPGIRRILGGPLVACWAATGQVLRGGAFDLFDQVVAGSDADLDALVLELGGIVSGAKQGPLTLDLDEPDWDAYLAPMPVVPVALGRGCYWRRCTFCPDHLHAKHNACEIDALERWLELAAAKFPQGAMLHLTDSALPPRHLERIARFIAQKRLPLRWHGFVRPEPVFTDERFVHRLAEGGCEMLQIGVESGSARLLELMGKGADVDVMRRMLQGAHAAGIRCQVYLLFGLPTETDADRELTLKFVEDEAEAICDINHALLNLPRGSPMHQRPEDYRITRVVPFHAETDLSLYDDFFCGDSHPRVEARRWLDHRFLKSGRVREILQDLRAPFKANHACFLPRR